MAMIENEVEKKVYKVEDVQNLLGLGRSKAYEFVENVYYDRKTFRVLKIGRSYRILCNSFEYRIMYLKQFGKNGKLMRRTADADQKSSGDWNYICCSTYGNPRSKGFHQKYYKNLLKSLDLPDIHFHQLRNTYATILLKNSFNSKGVSHLLGHAKEIISVDVYGDTQEIIEDCLDVLEPFIEGVIPKERKEESNICTFFLAFIYILSKKCLI